MAFQLLTNRGTKRFARLVYVGGHIGALWHANATNGDAAGVRLSISIIYRTTGEASYAIHRHKM